MKSRTFFGNIVTSIRKVAAPFGLAVAISGGLLLAPAASAEVGPQGSVKMVLGSGKAAKALAADGVRISASGGAVPTRLSGGKVRVVAPVSDVSVTEDRSVVSLLGSLVFSKGTTRVVVGQLSLVSREDGTIVKGRLGKSVIQLFRAGGPAEVDTQVGTFKISGRATGLTKPAARALGGKFGIANVPASRLGTSSTSKVQAAFADPYAELCSLPATSKVAGTLPEADTTPEIASPTTAAGQAISWGFRDEFRNYLFRLPGGQGVMQGFDGATVTPGASPAVAPSGFSWSFASGEFNAASTGVATDQVVLGSSGTITLCHKAQFRVNLSNPAVVIDGLTAQLVFDVDTNVQGNWIPTQRVVLANLVTSDRTSSRTQNSSSISWVNVPVSLTETGSDALRLAEFSPTFRFQAGQLLKAIDFSVSAS